MLPECPPVRSQEIGNGMLSMLNCRFVDSCVLIPYNTLTRTTATTTLPLPVAIFAQTYAAKKQVAIVASYAMSYLISAGGYLRHTKPRFCSDCGLPLGYYADMRTACGWRSLFLERSRYLGRLATLCHASSSRFQVLGNELGILGNVQAFVVGDYEVASRLRTRCVIWQLTMNQLEASFLAGITQRDFRQLMSIISCY